VYRQDVLSARGLTARVEGRGKLTLADGRCAGYVALIGDRPG
jgi:hypothetical protein